MADHEFKVQMVCSITEAQMLAAAGSIALHRYALEHGSPHDDAEVYAGFVELISAPGGAVVFSKLIQRLCLATETTITHFNDYERSKPQSRD